MPRALGFAQFQQALIRAHVERVYLLDGEEGFFHEEGIRLLTRTLLTEGAATLDRESLRGAESSLDEVLDLASTYPMGGGLRLIVVRGADGLRSASPDRLKRYLERPNPKSCVVFSDAAFDRRRVLYRTLCAGAARVECALLDDAQTAAWVRERLRERGFGISTDLAEAIAAGSAGQGLARLDAELQKLMSAIGAPRPVESGDLAILADVPRVADAFRLAARIARGERGEAVLVLRALLLSGEEPVRLLGGLSWYFRNALKARVAAARRMPAREIAALYGLHPERLERLQREIGPADARVLRGALAECLRADRELKGGGAKDPAHALEGL
ncbi:MAG TPA: DNA polymerase III subunit delta, partial [Candidatus Polarisedimenticolia bacterium]|nr:DNA polymerase III subunit delta [Candidatus Polarisedimenticolia bacterium]